MDIKGTAARRGVATRIRMARQNAGIETAVALARKLAISDNTVWRYENEARPVPLGRIEQIAKITNVRVEWLLYGIAPMKLAS